MNEDIKKAYVDARKAYEAACVAREGSVVKLRADYKAKVKVIDDEVAKLYEAHNIAKKAYAMEVGK